MKQASASAEIQVPYKDEMNGILYIIEGRLVKQIPATGVICIDRMFFGAQGYIKPFIITQEGVAKQPLK